MLSPPKLPLLCAVKPVPVTSITLFVYIGLGLYGYVITAIGIHVI